MRRLTSQTTTWIAPPLDHPLEERIQAEEPDTDTMTDEQFQDCIANLVDFDDDDALLRAARNRDEIRAWQQNGWEEGKCAICLFAVVILTFNILSSAEAF
jgi:hypothetical protein